VARTVYLETYGCQMNIADTELILGHLGTHGYAAVSEPERADVILLNTCAIREHAEERVVGRLTDLARLKAERRDRILGICGCMAQHHRAALTARVPALDLVVGPDAYRRLPDLLDAAAAARGPRGAAQPLEPLVDVRLDPGETYDDLPAARPAGAVRAWITVMRGCDKFCTFCVVPYVRGRERSLPADAVLAGVRRAAEAGSREVVFLGQTVNAYHDGTCSFAELLRRAAEIEGIARIRFTSPHPADVTPELIHVMATVDKIAPQLHLPVQSGSDSVLRAMERGYTVARYRDLVERVRASIPDVALSTDVIVGFPGEGPADFDATCRLLEEVGFEQAYLYKYSRRTMTKAARWPDPISPEEKGRRLAHVIAIQESISAARNRAWIGREVEVLVEGPARRPQGHVAGKTAQFTTAIVEGPAAPGELVRATVESATAHTLITVGPSGPRYEGSPAAAG
jgi:tRNA-2-methylthio-N6-dimethylallyladenosine synthase